MGFKEKCQDCVWVIIGRTLRRFPLCVWVMVVHQFSVHSSKQSWHIRVTLYLETHTGEPLKGLAYRRPSPHCSHTHVHRRPAGGETHRTRTHRNGLHCIGHCCSCIRQRDRDRRVWFRERASVEDWAKVQIEEMSFRAGPPEWQGGSPRRGQAATEIWTCTCTSEHSATRAVWVSDTWGFRCTLTWKPLSCEVQSEPVEQ